jgi:chromosomal replication initiator protein
MNSKEDLFEQVKLHTGIPETSFDSFIKPLRILDLSGGAAAVYMENEWACGFIRDTYGDKIRSAWKSVLGLDVETTYYNEVDCPVQYREDFGKDIAIPELQDDPDMMNRLNEAETRSNYQFTFENFIVAESNHLAFSACRRIADGLFGKHNPLYIYSEPGLGKTHLLTAIKNEIVRKNPGINIVYATAEQFVKDFVGSLSRLDGGEKMRDYYRKADMLLMDDVQFLSGKEASQQAMFDVFNSLHQKGRQIVLTSDRPPKDINDIEKRLASRFEWGLMADIGLPETDTRARIIRRKAELMEFEIPEKIVNYIAERIKSNIRRLEGVITKMHAMCELTESQPTLILAQNVLREYLSGEQQMPATVDKIIKEVADTFAVSEEEIRGPGRNGKVSTARQVAIYVIYKITGMSYTAIGQEFSGRDHSTIVYAIKQVTDKIQKNPGFRSRIDDIIKAVG